jgi:hypothetical protein
MCNVNILFSRVGACRGLQLIVCAINSTRVRPERHRLQRDRTRLDMFDGEQGAISVSYDANQHTGSSTSDRMSVGVNGARICARPFEIIRGGVMGYREHAEDRHQHNSRETCPKLPYTTPRQAAIADVIHGSTKARCMSLSNHASPGLLASIAYRTLRYSLETGMPIVNVGTGRSKYCEGI